MSEMIERVAIALAKTNGGDFYDPNFYTEEQRNVWRTKARDGIAAMREPTKEMLDDGAKAFAHYTDARETTNLWQAMIDAALK